MRDALVGLIAIPTIPVYWGLKLLRIKHDYDFMDLAGLMIPVLLRNGCGSVGVTVLRALAVCALTLAAPARPAHALSVPGGPKFSSD